MSSTTICAASSTRSPGFVGMLHDTTRLENPSTNVTLV
jgi:hypothetical protein